MSLRVGDKTIFFVFLYVRLDVSQGDTNREQ